MRTWLVALGWIVFVAALSGCGNASESSGSIAVTAAQWPQADALFHRDPRWLGSDAAFSVPLHDGRILWLFNDTVLTTTPAHIRSGAAFVRNTLAIERGTNPTSASMTFYWRRSRGRPASFYPEEGSRWFWPQHGIRLGRALVVFLHRVQTNPAGGPGFNFEGAGWRAAVVEDASGSPVEWRVHVVKPPSTLAGFAVGGAVSLVGAYAVSLATRGDRFTGYLVRWRADDLASGRLGEAEWWAGRRGWVPASNQDRPTPILAKAGPECSLTFDPTLDRWVLVRSEGFGATTIVVSFARKIEGPWSKPRLAYRPPESSRPNPNVYAAKGHPELTGADLAVTYATKTYPRFVRLTFSRR